MHWSGNVAIYLCLICWGATVPLLAKLMTIRNAWTKEVTTLAVANEANAEQIDQLEEQRQKLRDSIDVTTKAWGQVWPNREIINYNPAAGQLTTDLTEADGLGAPDPTVKPILTHMFRPMEPQDVKKVGRKLAFYAEDAQGSNGEVGRLTGVVTEIDETDPNPLNHELTVTVTDEDGNARPYVLRTEDVLDDEWEYMGRFKVTGSGDVDSVMVPDWKPRPVDLTSIAPQDRQLWDAIRFRERAPVDAATLTSEMYGELHYNDELYNERQTIRDLAQENLSRHQARVAKRLEELLGTPDGSSPGLQNELLEAERERNEGLARLDDLRRRIDAAYAKQQELVGEVGTLGAKLPGAGG